MAELSKADALLLEQIQQGDAEAWSRLVDRYRGRLLAFARSRVRDAADAEDLLQDTFVCFLKGLDSFRGEAAVETYLFTILRRRIIDWYRGRKLSACSLQDAFGGEEDEAGSLGNVPGPAETASWYARRAEAGDLRREALGEALKLYAGDLKEALDFRDLKIIELLFYAHVPNKRAGEMLQMDEKQIALIKHRALKKIRAHVQRQMRGGGRSDQQLHDAMLTEVWDRMRPSCPKRNTIGAWLLGSLEDDWADYVDFHLNQLGCRFCQANLADLEARTADDSDQVRNRILESTVGFLRQSYRQQ
jgi:RNA polymerase sigma factor (sigma-70 family)